MSPEFTSNKYHFAVNLIFIYFSRSGYERGLAVRLSIRITRHFAGFLAMTGCVNRSYEGVDLRPDGAPPEIQALAYKASGGDKMAQVQLGARYEVGQGLPVNCRRATALYRRAATDSRGTRYVYMPMINGRIPGRVIPVQPEPPQKALPLAKLRLLTMRPCRHGGR